MKIARDVAGITLGVSLGIAWAQWDRHERAAAARMVEPEYRDAGPVDIPPAWARGNDIRYRIACKTHPAAIDYALALQAGKPPIFDWRGCRPMRTAIPAKVWARVSWGYEVHGIAFSVWQVTDAARETEYVLLPDDFGPGRVGT